MALGTQPITENAARRIVRDAQLELLNIDSQSQPTVTRYPQTFNPAAAVIWRDLINSPEYKAFCAGSDSAAARWKFAVMTFLKNCKAQDMYPFSGAHDFEEVARKFLRNARTTLIDWFHQSKVFDYVRLASVTRESSFTHNNFRITVRAKLRPISDPTFERWLVMRPHPGFVREGSMYANQLRAHLRVEFEVVDGQPTMNYSVFCHTPIRAFDVGRYTSEHLSRYVDEKLWKPLIRELPITGAGSRLY